MTNNVGSKQDQVINSLPDDKTLDSSKLKDFADENSRKLFKQCFQKAYFPEASKGAIVWEWVKWLPFQNWRYAFFISDTVPSLNNTNNLCKSQKKWTNMWIF